MGAQRCTGSLSLMKRINRQLVLEKIKENQPISRAKIAKDLGLSKTTVSAICDDLLARHMILDLGERGPEQGSGRPSKMLGFNPRSACGVGVELSPRRALWVVTDLNGQVLCKMETEPMRTEQALAQQAHVLVEKAGMAPGQLIALGVAVMGTVSRQGVVMRANSMGWQNYDLQSQLQRFVPCPVCVQNESNCAALGERWCGSGQRAEDLCYVSISDSIGGAIISEGMLIHGAQGRAGELGYLITTQEFARGQRNVLGQPGVFERWLHQLLQAGEKSPKEMIAAYLAGQVEVRPIMDEFLRNLSLLLANLISLLNPEILVLGGSCTAWLEPLLPSVRMMAETLTPTQAKIVLGGLGIWAPAIGAVAAALTHGEERVPGARPGI